MGDIGSCVDAGEAERPFSFDRKQRIVMGFNGFNPGVQVTVDWVVAASGGIKF